MEGGLGPDPRATSPRDLVDTFGHLFPTALCLLDTAGQYVAVNDAYCQLYGYTRDELLGQPAIPRVLAPETWEAAQADFARFLRASAPAQPFSDRPRRRKDGTQVWLDGMATQVSGPAGEPWALVAVHEVTTRRQAEVALRERTAQLEAVRAVGLELTRELDLTRLLERTIREAIGLLGAASGAVWLWDPAAERLVPLAFCGHDPAWFAPLRLRLGEGTAGTVAQTCTGLIVPDRNCSPFLLPVFQRPGLPEAVLAEPLFYQDRLLGVLAVDRWKTDPPFGPADQELLRLFTSHATIAIENARLYRAVQAELAKRTRAEAALREASTYHRSLVEANLDAMVVFDLTGRITDVNSEAEAMLGLTRAEVLGAEIWAFLTTGDEARGTMSQILRDGQLRDYPTAIRHRDGHTTPVLSNITVHCSAAGAPAGFLAVSRNISAQTQLAEEYLIRGKLESTGLLAGGIAHDFNNLLTIILGNLDLLEVTPAAEQVELRSEMRSAIAEAHALTQQFLAFANGGAMGRRQAVAVGALCCDAVSLALRGGPITARLHLPDILWPVHGDARQLRQALQNLLRNATEALPKSGQITLTAENCPGPAPQVRFTLTDDGIGIAPDRLPQVFDPYFSTKQRGSQRGMGLGLTVARAIVEQHGGTLTLTSTAGVGTTATVTLPIAPGSIPSPLAAPTTHRLLVMEGEAGVRTMLGRRLAGLGYSADLAAHGDEAIRLARAALTAGRPYALALLDLTVKSGLGGVATLQCLRRFDPLVRAIVMSGAPGHPVLQDPAMHGFQGALRKPFTEEEFVAILQASLR